MLNRLKEWSLSQVRRPNVMKWLSVLSFTEASFFLIPPDPLLIVAILQERAKWLRDILVTTVASVLGGLLGFAIGALFYDTLGAPLVEAYGLTEYFNSLAELFGSNAFWAIFIAAFTPVPYKVFTIGSGLFGVSLVTFILASFIGRGLRFFIVGALTYYFGEGVVKLCLKYLNYATLLVVAAVVVYLLARFAL